MADDCGSRARWVRDRRSPSPYRRGDGRRADPDHRRQREEPEAGARRAAGKGLCDAGSRDGRGGRPPGEGAAARARPDGHPAPRDRRHRRARPATGRRGDTRDPGDRRHRVGDDPGPPEDHGGRVRRLPVEADPPAGVPARGAGDAGPRMSAPRKILVVDDTPQNVKLLADLLRAKGYAVATAKSGREALEQVDAEHPDLVLLDVVMPEMSGYDVCRKLRGNLATATLPIIMVTALDPAQERVKGIEAGADDFLSKPINQPELLARVKSLLRIKLLHEELAEWNRTLEQRVEQQLAQLERLERLKRFFSPQLAEMIVSGDAEDPLRSHRREISVVFLDLRGFTAFAETSEPEEVMGVLREYHAEMGRLILEHEGTLERFTGDGMMIFFNDPVPVPDAPQRAIRMAAARRSPGRSSSPSASSARSRTSSRWRTWAASRSRASRSPSPRSTSSASGASRDDALVEVAGDEAPRLAQERRLLAAAPLHRVRAARVEAAARRRREWARHLARQDDLLPLLAGMRRQGGREERLRVGVLRRGGDRRRVADLDDPAEVHHRDRVAHVGDRGEVVGDEEIREAELRLEVPQEVQDLGADRDVERRHGLVEHDELRGERERARDRDPLPLAARELVREEIGGAVGQPHQLEQAGDALRDLAGPEPLVGDERLGDDLVHAHARVERGERILEHGLDRAAIGVEHRAVQRLEVAPLESDHARRRLLEEQDQLRGRRLAAPGLADEAQRPPRLDAERHLVHGAHHGGLTGEEPAPHGEVLGQVERLDDGPGHSAREPAAARVGRRHPEDRKSTRLN